MGNKYIAIVISNSADGTIKEFENEKEAKEFLNNVSDLLYIKLLIEGKEIKLK